MESHELPPQPADVKQKQKGTTEEHQNDQQQPRILACGYHRVSIAKTNNHFPAWLVLIPSPDNDCWGEQTKKSSNPSGSCDGLPQWSCHWRSKRDFILLSRSLVAPSSKNQNLQCRCNNPQSKLRVFPKAPFQKLCNQSPWRRPAPLYNANMDEDLHDFRKCLTNPSSLEEISKQPKNEYQATMKKNLFQMDQFLQAIHRHARCGGGGCLVDYGFGDDGANSMGALKIQKAWKLFCRPLDCEVMTSSKDPDQPQDTPSLALPVTDTAASNLPTPQSLGQYFCTPENATQVWLLYFAVNSAYV